VWHSWAAANYDRLQQVDGDTSGVSSTQTSSRSQDNTPSFGGFRSPNGKSKNSRGALPTFTSAQKDIVTPFVVEAIKGFVNSIKLGDDQPIAYVLQDILRLLTLWFKFGMKMQVNDILRSQLDDISAEYWLKVVPQLIARMHVQRRDISYLLQVVYIIYTHQII